MSLAAKVSTVAFVAISLFMLVVVVVGGGGLLSGYSPLGFFEVTPEEGKAIAAKILKMASPRAPQPSTEAKYVAAALVFPRVEAALFLGMGAGAAFSLARLEKGTKEVATARLMHAVWGWAVCLVHAQNAGFIGEPEVHASVTPMLLPFTALTFTLGSLSAAAAYLSFTADKAKGA